MHPHNASERTPTDSRITLLRFGGAQYAAHLQRHGYAVIGQGGGFSFPATYVLAKPDKDAVIKVGVFPEGDPWPLYAEWCFANPGPCRPMIRSLRWHGRGLDRFFVASMDRLVPPNWSEHQALILALHDWYEMTAQHGIDRRDWHDGPMDPSMTEWLADRLDQEGLSNVAQAIRTLTTVFPMLRMDPQPCNWMLTPEGRLVMIDPFTRTSALLPLPRSRLTKGRVSG